MLCPRMHKPVVVGRPLSRAAYCSSARRPGTKSRSSEGPFAVDGGQDALQVVPPARSELERGRDAWDRVYFAARVRQRCFPGNEGGDRVPASPPRSPTVLVGSGTSSSCCVRSSCCPSRQARHHAVSSANAPLAVVVGEKFRVPMPGTRPIACRCRILRARRPGTAWSRACRSSLPRSRTSRRTLPWEKDNTLRRTPKIILALVSPRLFRPWVVSGYCW